MSLRDKVLAILLDGRYRTLEELATLTAGQPASISARLREIGKVMRVEKRLRGANCFHLFEYRINREPSP